MSDQERDGLAFTLGEVRGTVNSLVESVGDISKRLREVEKKLWYVCGGSVVIGVIGSKIVSSVDWLGIAVRTASAAGLH